MIIEVKLNTTVDEFECFAEYFIKSFFFSDATFESNWNERMGNF